MRKQLRLSPYDPKQKLRLTIDGAKTADTGSLLIQYVDDNKDVAKGAKIIHLGSNLLPCTGISIAWKRKLSTIVLK